MYFTERNRRYIKTLAVSKYTKYTEHHKVNVTRYFSHDSKKWVNQR